MTADEISEQVAGDVVRTTDDLTRRAGLTRRETAKVYSTLLIVVHRRMKQAEADAEAAGE